MRPKTPILVAYALPAIALAALYLPLFTYVTPFYVAERGVDLAAIGFAWLAIRLFDALSDPLMGWLSDRTPPRWGRRRVWLAAAVPVILIATWQAFVPPENAGLGHAVFWLALVVVGWTMAQTPYAAWGAELSDDYHGRVHVTAWREAMVLVGTLLTTIVYFVAGGGGEGLRAIAVALVVFLPLSVIVTVLVTPDRAGRSTKRPTFGEGMRALAANAPFRRLLAAWFVNGAANGLPATLFLFFVADRLGDPDAAGWLIVVYFVSAIAGVPLWGMVSAQIGKHRAWGWAMAYSCVVFSGALFLTTGDIGLFAAVCVLTGLALGADLTLPPAIQADVVELDTRITGAERAGLFFALWQVATKASVALSSGLALVVLGYVGFAAGETNDPTALTTLSWLYAGVPIVLKLIAVAMMWNFPLDRAAVTGEPPELTPSGPSRAPS